jgi:hypothetical protein
LPLPSVVAVAEDSVAPLSLTGSVKVTVTPPAGVDVDPLVLVTVAVMMLTCPTVTDVVEAPIDTAYAVVDDPVLVIVKALVAVPAAA